MQRLERSGIGRREQVLVLAAMAVNAAIVVTYVLVRQHHPLVGDAPEYHAEGQFIAHGHWWWTATPFGIPHAGAWKAPVYPAFVGVVYALLGEHYERVELLQALVLAPLTVGLTWWLGRRLFGRPTGIAVACIVAVYPGLWQWYGLLYSESIAIPLTLALLLLVLGREPTLPRAGIAGAVLGANVLTRPSSVLLLAGVAVAWVVAAGLRRGVGMTALTTVVAVLVISPWTIRNANVLHGFLPVSIQDAAAYGTFNSDAANDPVNPYGWRAYPRALKGVIDLRHPISDISFRAKLQDIARTYVKKHPDALAEAFFWNGVTRTWDVRRPARILDEPHFDGRSKGVTAVGMGMWWILLVLALTGLWRWRHRREFVLPVLALALAASVVYTTESGTRYRATLEPLFIVAACSAIPWLAPRTANASGESARRVAPDPI